MSVGGGPPPPRSGFNERYQRSRPEARRGDANGTTGVNRMRYADRMRDLGTETAFEVLAKARALEAKGRTIVHLEIGEPDFDTPANIRAAAAP